MEKIQNNHYVKDIKEIRTMMEKSSKFISLSGISGIIAGVIALLGTAAAWWYLHNKLLPELNQDDIYGTKIIELKLILFLLIDAFVVLILAFAVVLYFGMSKAKKQQVAFWNKSAELTISNLLIPLIAGGVFCVILYQYHLYFLIAPSTLLFYGLALLNASKYTLYEIRYLALCDILLGLIACIFPLYTLYFWAFGFGVLHILYGSIMYYKYDR